MTRFFDYHFVFSFLTIADWSKQVIKKGREPKQLIYSATLNNVRLVPLKRTLIVPFAG